MQFPCVAAMAPIFIQLSKDGTGAYSYNPVAVNLLVELAKTIFAFAVLLVMVRLCTPWCAQAVRHVCKRLDAATFECIGMM